MIATEHDVFGMTDDGSRVRIVIDECPDKPYDDGASPVIGCYGPRTPHQSGPDTAWKIPDDAVRAFGAFSVRMSGMSGWERYMRIFHGCTAFQWWDHGDWEYVTFDPAAWREWVGAPAGSISMEEWRAYCEGDVFLVVTESLACDKCGTWQRDDVIGGFYGLDAATEYAKELCAEGEQR